MYNLFVSGNPEAWDGEPWLMEKSRCLHEHTEEPLRDRYGSFSSQAIAELRRYPCIFAYELADRMEPKFGRIREITARQNQVRVNYEIVQVTPFITAAQLSSHLFELDINKFELYRTHWALKNASLGRELGRLGVVLPEWATSFEQTVNVLTHRFDIALSFPGAVRRLVESIAAELERDLGPDAYFYDKNFEDQLARPNLDTLLQSIYRDRSRLIVVFLGSNYQSGEWPGIEFRAIREIIFQRQTDRLMFIRTDEGEVEGVFRTDGYVDARGRTPREIATLIQRRLQHVPHWETISAVL